VRNVPAGTFERFCRGLFEIASGHFESNLKGRITSWK
jgi:hypothetical protein